MCLRQCILVPAVALLAALPAHGANFGVSSTADSGEGSLRQAILDANASSGDDVIAIGIDATVLQPATPLPAVTASGGLDIIGNANEVVIDGTLLSAADSVFDLAGDGIAMVGVIVQNCQGNGILVSGNNCTVSGCYVSANAVGIRVTGDNAQIGTNFEVAPNYIVRNTTTGILVTSTATGCIIQGNGIGLDTGGLTTAPNAVGVTLDGAAGVQFLFRNFIAGNFGVGIDIRNGSTGTSITGTAVGLAADGAGRPNNSHGILIREGSSATTIGDDFPGNETHIGSNLGDGINANGATGITLVSAFIGVGLDGSADRGNFGNGITASNTDNLQILGSSSTNLIAYNDNHAIAFSDGEGLVVTASHIGVLPSGAAAANSGYGIFASNASGGAIGDIAPGTGNFIAANGLGGIRLEAGCSEIPIQRNVIGISPDQTLPLPNNGHGIAILGSTDCIIGGEALGNVLCGNNGSGIYLGPGASRTQVAGNRIGITAADDIHPNTGQGIWLEGATGNTIGLATNPDARNYIAGNSGNGILVDINATDNSIIALWIGLDGAGNAAGNALAGIRLNPGSSGNTIGGDELAEGNFVSAHPQQGILLQGSLNNTILNNRIGLATLNGGPNLLGGIAVVDGAADNIIGQVGSGNVILQNTGAGVSISGILTDRNTIRANSIHTNAGGGIVLSDGGNNNLPAPVLTHTSPITGATAPGATVDIFVDNFDQGDVYLGTVAANGSGDISASFDLDAHRGRFLTATATLDGDTSEFSQPLFIPLAEEGEAAIEGEAEDGEAGGDGEGEEPNPQLLCPDGAAFSQLVDPAAVRGAESNAGGRIVYDNYQLPPGEITGIRWWGRYSDANFLPCAPLLDSFRVSFHADDNGSPGELVAERDVSPTVSLTGRPSEEHVFDASFIDPVPLRSGWVSVVNFNNIACTFQWSGGPLNQGGSITQLLNGNRASISFDMAFCLTIIPGEGEGEAATEGEGEAGIEGEGEATTEGEGEAMVEGEGEAGIEGEPTFHSGDTDTDSAISFTELLRVVQLYNAGAYRCATSSTEDGYEPGPGDCLTCTPHDSDYTDNNCAISLSELLRLIQLYNNGNYSQCTSEDGWC